MSSSPFFEVDAQGTVRSRVVHSVRKDWKARESEMSCRRSELIDKENRAFAEELGKGRSSSHCIVVSDVPLAERDQRLYIQTSALPFKNVTAASACDTDMALPLGNSKHGAALGTLEKDV